MRKLYALFSGFVVALLAITSVNARTLTPDVANFTFTVDAPNLNVDFANTSTLGTEPGLRKAYWSFGDGITQMTPPLQGILHHYSLSGTYTVCLRIYRYGTAGGDSVLSAYVCKTVLIEATCRANFESPATSPTPLGKYFIAQPWHSQNKKPLRICWTFGDGRDTCIQYSTTYTGVYAVYHLYGQAGIYNVCVNILYDGGCQAQSCHSVQVGSPDSCHADFERLPGSITANPLAVVYKPLPSHNNNKKPSRICWTFGDGRDTCIDYLNIYIGQYTVPHTYVHPGLYQVCIHIQYYGGCEATNCKPIQVGRLDTCHADFERILPGVTANPLLAYFNALPQHNNNRKPSRICWTFGDNRDTCINYTETYTGSYAVSHLYHAPGSYQVCVDILYFGGCEANNCKPIEIARPDTCHADFERIQPSPTALLNYFRALPQHNNNRKPSRICWTFGDNRDTCINYTETYTGQYVVSHEYHTPGSYQVCVHILYFGGCEASNCHPIQVGRPDTCHADFERILPSPTALLNYFRALPQHNNNRKPSRICWTFGDNRDTCINYTETYTGQYVVSHEYHAPGSYQVCVHILYFGGCEATNCHLIGVGIPDTCHADFERILPSPTALLNYFRALPQHNNNRKPSRICWTFGDNRDTCINYTETYTGQYVVSHEYHAPGSYQVCVHILYFGGCEASNCHSILVGRPDTCHADFERLPNAVTANPLLAYFNALPQHNNNRKPSRICWTFGDNRDTCIDYTETYTGQYIVRHEYHTPGSYEVCVHILYFGGCEASKCHSVVIAPPQNCTVNLFEIMPSITSLIRSFYASTSSTPPRRPEQICWHFGDGSDTCIIIDPYQPVPVFLISHRFPGPGAYRVCVNVLFQGGCTAENCKEVVIGGNSNVCGGYMTDSLTAPRSFKFHGFSIHAPADNVLSYHWTFGDGTSGAGQEVTHTYSQPGNYQVCLYITTQSGCETRVCKPLQVSGYNEPALHLSPNPVINELHVDFLSTHTEQVTIKILDGIGVIVRTYIRNVTLGANSWSHDLSSLLPGVYTYIVQSPDQLASAIFIKQ